MRFNTYKGRYSYEELIAFLNDLQTHKGSVPDWWDENPELPEKIYQETYQKGVKQAHKELNRYLTWIIDYRRKIESTTNERLRRSLSQKLGQGIAESMEGNFQGIKDARGRLDVDKVHKITFQIDIGGDAQPIGSPDYLNYYLTFLDLISDLGIDRLLKCKECGKIRISTYNRPQHFCSDACRRDFHNRKNAPKMAEYMRRNRATKKILAKKKKQRG